MKLIKLYIPLLVLLLLTGSCKKYLDINRTNLQTPIKTLEDCQMLLNNNQILNNGYPTDGMLSADGFYVNDQEYNLGGDLSDRPFFTWNASAIRQTAEQQWQNTYKAIYYANVALEYAEKIGTKAGADVAILNDIRGQALFFRAFAHWQIAQLYCKPYSTATSGTDPGIPLKLQSDINEVVPRGTVQNTYDRIIQDLTEAVELLKPTSIVPTRPNKSSAYAMLARVYNSMEDYPKALTNATAALQLYNQLLDYNSLNPGSPFDFGDNYNIETIFHSSINANPYLLEPESNGEYVARIDNDLVNAYGVNDLRKDLLLSQNPDGSYRSTTGFRYNGLSVDELYFIRAESYARAGNTTVAMADLNTLLITRWKTGTYVDMTAPTADEALIKVLEERRKGLLMRGLRWTDLRRLNKDTRFAKTLTRTVLGVTYTLPPNDPRYVLLIPQEVITYGKIEQNPR